jgi:hypothetical protein
MLQRHDLALTVELTIEDENSRFFFKTTSWKLQIGTRGIIIKNYIDFTNFKKFFIQKDLGKAKHKASLICQKNITFLS